VSALSIRRRRAPWWTEDDWGLVQRVNDDAMPHYYAAKMEAEEELTVRGERRAREEDDDDDDAAFRYVVLRPGGLADGEPEGRVVLGKTRARGWVRRADVADVAARLLEVGATGWVDMLAGDGARETGEEIERFVEQGENSMEGESLSEMEERVDGKEG
jgi:hypothetical protein